ncbi:MAG: protein translocase subunit SecF [Patescibacteria group bacterium]
MIDLIGKKNIFLGFSGVIVILSIILISVFGLRSGIDLKGGTQWEFAFKSNQNILESQVNDALKKVNPSADATIKKTDANTFLIRLGEVSEETHQAYLTALKNIDEVAEKNFSNIGPTIGGELRRKAFWAIGFVMLAISIYIGFAFRKVSEPVKSWKYGLITLITLFHDVIIPAGLLAFLGFSQNIEIDTNFIVALLVVMGFSVHDTIVVFDRIRENLLLRRGKKIDLKEVVNASVNETIARSINTSLTLVLVLLALIILGPSSLFYFILTILVGTIFGTYSSIFVASPLLYLWGKSAK